MSKLVLIDGHSILNRAFYGVPDLTNSEGLHTNAVYGFLNILFKILDEESPEYLTVAFDVHAPTFRHEKYAEYKGTRKPMADELREQVPVIKEVLKAMRIKTVELPGYEADDILGTLAKRAEKDGMEVSLVSGDRDLLQIATSKIKIRIPKTKGGKTEIEDYYDSDVYEKYGVSPEGFIDLKALMGDTADNIPGVPKVGEKTASELMAAFGSLDGIYEHLEEITKNAIRESLRANRELADLSKDLATIRTNAPVDYSYDEAKIADFYTDEAYVLFKKLEFRNYLERFEKGISYDTITASFRLIEDYAEASDFISKVKESKKPVGLFLLFDDKDSGELLGMSLSTGEETAFIRKWMLIGEDFFTSSLPELSGALPKIRTAYVKSLYRFLPDPGPDRFDDIIIGAYLLNPLKSDYRVTDIANEYLNMLIADKSEWAKKLSLREAMEQKPAEFLNYVCFLSYIPEKAAPLIEERLSKEGMLRLYLEMEMPLTRVLFDMEQTGIRVVPEKLKDYSDMLGANIEKLEKRIYEEAGEEFNLNSPKQLGEILFEKLAIPGGKKTKTGYSTAVDVLEKLKFRYPIVNDILEYRAYAKLKSTYADGLVSYIDPDQRIRSTFHQTITATGRLSSADPNLQNIPIRMELGRKIRKVFVPGDGFLFMDADYSQIELRLLASLSGDPVLIRAYNEHADIHRSTASLVFHVPYDEVTDLQRRNAKAVNFGIVYGISAFGLGEDLGISQKDAKQYIEDYFLTYPKIKEYLDGRVAFAKDKGYTETFFGRRRPIPELKSSNFMQRSFGERVAMNAPIQGTAADIIKIAMIRVWKRLKEEHLESRLILQVHDELLLEVKKGEEEACRKILTEEMTGAADLPVALEIDLHTGSDWFEAK
ncbi:MAG: DNA polymerase I [Lachnospiraceae bacterium]|nr:DNA polymerase I [Lachnospiraceae bacterium]